MDLHLTGARATAEEQAAVDSVAGLADSGAAAAANGNSHAPAAAEGRLASAGSAMIESRRNLLLPVLHAIQARIGWISQGALNYAAERLGLPPAEVHGVASFYGMFSLEARPAAVAHVCDDIACMARGAEELC